jgi:ribosomal protein L29
MKFENICNKIINEAKSKKEKVDGKKDKPEIIAEKETEVKPEDTQIVAQETEVSMPAFEGIELEFFEKFIEFAELNCLIKCQKSIRNDFKKILGKENGFVDEYLNKHAEEQQAKLEELKVELTSLREQIQTAEKENVEKAERRLSIVSILDKVAK